MTLLTPTTRLVAALAIGTVTPAVSLAQAQDPHVAMNQRGAMVMGFDQDKTAHHFLLYADGGAIAVDVKDAEDTTNLTAIRSHLPHIAMMFGQGNFDAPMLVHDTTVPGTKDMAALKDTITWTYVETPRGGRVNITSTNADALKAIHAFLRYQITDHKTGDSLEIIKR